MAGKRQKPAALRSDPAAGALDAVRAHYPDGLGTDARFQRWLADNNVHPVVDSESGRPVLATGGELYDLLFAVAERFYWYGADDARGRHGLR
jgi:hypothetical protein